MKGYNCQSGRGVGGKGNVRNHLANTKVGEERGRGGASGYRADDSLLQPMDNTTAEQAFPCSPWRKPWRTMSRFVSKDCSP